VPRLSIIIPALGNSARLESTLVSVLENRPPDCEIIVVHTGEYNDPYDLAGEICFLEMPAGTSLVGCINRAIDSSCGPVVHLLAAGVQVTERWTEAAMLRFQDPRVAAVAPVMTDILDRTRTIAAGLNYNCRRGRLVNTNGGSDTDSPTVVGPILQAAFFRRSALELLGGFSTEVGDELADVDTALILRYAGYCSAVEPRCVVLASASQIMPTAVGFREGLAAERLFWRTAPITGWAKSLGAHPLGVIGDFIATLPRLGAWSAMLGRFLAVCQLGKYRAHYQWLLDVRRTAAALFQGMRPQILRIDGPHNSAARTVAPTGSMHISVQSAR
jgi:cellulose synthase/poly-beta-1,6-N-acetylglucosamine synthase-like glycosyltransferase